LLLLNTKKMDKLKISFSLNSPLITSGGYMTFDGLLAAVIFEKTNDINRAHTEIPLFNQDGLWYASAAIYETIDENKKSFVANLRAMHDLDLDLIAKGKNGNTHRTIGLTRRRDYGAVMNSYRMISSNEISWYVTGDAEKIGQLLSDIEFIGKRRNSGFGQVSNLRIQPDDLDGVVGNFGEPLRPVPLEMFPGDKSSIKFDASWKPAYWHPSNRAICYAPPIR
jgi:CRISPR type IV-associated protein Csf3